MNVQGIFRSLKYALNIRITIDIRIKQEYYGSIKKVGVSDDSQRGPEALAQRWLVRSGKQNKGFSYCVIQ